MNSDSLSEQVEIAAARNGLLAELLAGIVDAEGFSDSAIPGVRLMKSSRPSIRAQVSYEPSIVIIAQGRKCGYLGEKKFVYDANHFLVLSVPLPFECETLSSPEGPLLGISIGVNPALIGSLMMELNAPPPIPMDDALYDATVRLVQTLKDPDDARILGPQVAREIVYRVLRGKEGGPLRALAAPHSHFGQISRVLQRIHRDYAKPLEMATLAGEAGMSVSTFHAHFKAVTSSPPLQYLKNIRLHKARTLMVHEGHTASSAALAVGYESASQFSREFKRFFGKTPAAETEFLKTNLLRLV